MPKQMYEVLESETVEHNGTVYPGGETLELEEKEAQSLIEAKVVKLIGAPTPPKPPAETKKTPGGEMAAPTGGIPKPVTELDKQ